MPEAPAAQKRIREEADAEAAPKPTSKRLRAEAGDVVSWRIEAYFFINQFKGFASFTNLHECFIQYNN